MAIRRPTPRRTEFAIATQPGTTSPGKHDEELYHQLLFYTLAHPDPGFIHQHAVDAWAAQHATPSSRPISIVFSLLGLYLFIEKGISGKQVQRLHMQLARRKREWPPVPQPASRGEITVHHVLAAAPGLERDQAIREWCASVWGCWRPGAAAVIEICNRELGIP